MRMREGEGERKVLWEGGEGEGGVRERKGGGE